MVRIPIERGGDPASVAPGAGVEPEIEADTGLASIKDAGKLLPRAITRK